MLAIRLQPVGKKGQRTFRVVVAESRSKLGGRPADRVGHYNPFTKELTVDEEKTRQWIQNGAQPSRTVHNLLVSAGIIEGVKIPVAIPEKEEALAPEVAQFAEEETQESSASAHDKGEEEKTSDTAEGGDEGQSEVEKDEAPSSETEADEQQEEDEESMSHEADEQGGKDDKESTTTKAEAENGEAAEEEPQEDDGEQKEESTEESPKEDEEKE